MTISYFRHLWCYDFCEQVERVQHHPELTGIFVANLRNNKVTLAGVTFIISSSIITDATRIPNVGEKWYKAQYWDEHYYEPYIKSRYRNEKKRTFPLRFLEDKYAPMMKIIMKYFTCEGRFSRFYGLPRAIITHNPPITLGFLCILQGWWCWTFVISYSVTLRIWLTLYRKIHTPSRWIVSITIPWSRWLCYIILISLTSPRRHSFPMTFSGVLKFLLQCLKNQKNLLAVLR